MSAAVSPVFWQIAGSILAGVPAGIPAEFSARLPAGRCSTKFWVEHLQRRYLEDIKTQAFKNNQFSVFYTKCITNACGKQSNKSTLTK